MKRSANVSKLRKLLASKREVAIDLVLRKRERLTLRSAEKIRTLRAQLCESTTNCLHVRRSILVSHANSDICSTAIFAMSGGIALPISFF